MRGSVYYQTAVLTKLIFFEGAKKSDRTNPNHEHYGCVSSFKTMESYSAKIGLNRTTMQELDRTQKRSLTGQ